MILEQTLSPGEKIKLFSSGNVFFSELERLINETKNEIHFQVYIFEADETGSRIANALLRAALRGVKIFMLIDAYGSSDFPGEMQAQLQVAGAEIKRYGPFIKGGRFHLGRRLHRKVIVFDNSIAIVAGLNISNNYNDVNNKKAWLDFAMVVNGNIVQKLHSICLQRWIKKPLRKMPMKTPKEKGFSTSVMKVRQNDWLRGLNEAHASYVREITNAQHTLFIVGGYFLPGGRVRNALKQAAERGVKIKIIIAMESDVAVQRNAVQFLYRWMLDNELDIYEYLPSNVHGKVLVADKKMAIVGSYDVNNLSTFSNIELNIDIFNEPLAAAFHEELEKISAVDCRKVTVEELNKRMNFWRRFKNWTSYQIVKSFFALATWTARGDDDEYQ